METFSHINDIADIIRALEHREEVRDRMTSLINATDKIESIRTALLQQELEERAAHPRDYHIPEFIVLFTLLEQQYQIIKTEIYRLRGNARLVAEIRNKEAQREEEVVVSLLITNKGVSTADHVIVDMDTNDHDYSLVGPHSQRLQQVANNNTATVAFTIKPHSSAPRLKFKITYDDAEKRGKQEQFADVVLLQDKQRPYVEIPNPYTSGTPIRERKMFYGRTNDIDTLRTKLSSVTANKVVVLSGQRRMGKTSLVYQLSNELAKGSQVPVMIDLQGQTLQSMGHLLLGLAQRIKQEVQQRRGIALITPGKDEFIESPIDSFNTYLADTLSSLGNEKLVFLLDEFEILQEKINNGPLNQDVLHYLRSLMQHRDGLNFLLVGAPRIRHVTEPSWSVFFNIALHHMLDELKQSEAEALIKEPVRDFLEYDMLALDRMHQLSGDLPYFIHVLSEALITYCNTEHKSYVTINDINNVLDTVLEEQSGSIKWIWNQSTSPLERLLLSILAQDEGEEGRIFTHSDLYQEFERLGIPYEQEKVTAALQDLVREDIIEERLNGMQHRIPIGLVKEWLRKEKPPARVIRDEFPDSEI
jgi:AAA+ ATPase superfamily predicted ATPase